MGSLTDLARQVFLAAQNIEQLTMTTADIVTNGAAPGTAGELTNSTVPATKYAESDEVIIEVASLPVNGTLADVNASLSDKPTPGRKRVDSVHSKAASDTAPNEPSADLEASKNALLDLTHSMQNMSRGPGALIYEHLYRFVDIASWLFICNFDVPAQVPLEGDISYVELGNKLNVRDAVVRRYIENLMVNGYFEESPGKPGYVRHTADSAAFVRDPKLLATISMLHDEMMPSIFKSVEALKKWPLSQETNESGFSAHNNTTDTMYQILAKNPVKAKRFGLAMSSFTKESFVGKHPLCTDYDWKSIDQAQEATVIDLGGSLGHLSMYLARETERIKFVIQDLPPTAAAGDAQCPEDMRSRVTFEAYDFLGPQKPRERPVDAILVANTLQNWPDQYVVKIMRNQIPVLAKGSKILIYERPLPETADPRWSRRVARTADMLMGSLLNGMLRTPQQWKDLFLEADPRFHFIGVKQIGTDKGVAEIVFDG